MRYYHNLLYISHGTSAETEGLKQALSLARNNEAALSVLVIGPEFPKEFPDYKTKYEESLLEEVKTSITATKKAIKLEDSAINIKFALAIGQNPVIKIVQHALQHGNDLVIKETEPRSEKTGFKALDMDLLRKCPVPLWLCRPIEQSRRNIHVAVAIDPENREPAAAALNKHMLEVARSLADSCSGQLNIISCWDYVFEEYLKHNARFKTADSEVIDAVSAAKQEHRTELELLIKASGIAGVQHVHHLRGRADEQIPKIIEKSRFDILVMGTLGRSGIPGFIVGNTAENIFQKLGCSLMALKPQGFTSPIKAF